MGNIESSGTQHPWGHGIHGDMASMGTQHPQGHSIHGDTASLGTILPPPYSSLFDSYCVCVVAFLTIVILPPNATQLSRVLVSVP